MPVLIDAALRAAAAFVDDNASSVAWDAHQHLSDEQRFAKSERIRVVASDLRVLADLSETQGIRYAQYGALKDRLYAFGLPLALKLDQNVAAAFRDAQGPTQPRRKGWLKPS